MAEELVFYTHPMSRGRIVRWMLEEVGQPYRTEFLGYGASMKSPEFVALNPMGKVPTLAHGKTVITEGAAICAYLADSFPQAGLAPPPGSAARGPYYRWMFYAAGPLEAAISIKHLGAVVPPEREVSMGFGNFAAVMQAMETAVTGVDYVAGGKFSAADVYFGSQIGWGLRFGTIEKRPAFETYWARISNRPAYKRATEIDDAELAKTSAP